MVSRCGSHDNISIDATFILYISSIINKVFNLKEI